MLSVGLAEIIYLKNYISKYSPELNIIEILWRKIKYEWMPFSAYNSFEDLEKSLFDILSGVGTEFNIQFS